MTDTSGDVVHIGPSLRTRLLTSAVGVLIQVAVLAFAARAELGPAWTAFFRCGAVFATVMIVVDLVQRGGIDLRPDAVVVNGRLRRRTVRWADVRDVRVDVTGQHVVLDRHSGRRVVLPVPSRGPWPVNGRAFEAGFAQIRERWQAHRQTP